MTYTVHETLHVQCVIFIEGHTVAQGFQNGIGILLDICLLDGLGLEFQVAFGLHLWGRISERLYWFGYGWSQAQ